MVGCVTRCRRVTPRWLRPPQTEALVHLWAHPQVHRHASGHRPLPPGRDAEPLVHALRAFLLTQLGDAAMM